jgi:CelD/BcsL family acetyltransferase involved in cellulose biosynthesis
METGEASFQTGEAVRRVREDGEHPSLLTEVVRGREQFLKLKTAWDAALTAGPDPSPALAHDFLRLWLESFAASRSPITLVVRRQQRIATALGLLLGSERVEGIPVRIAEGWTNAHSTRGGLLRGPDSTGAIPRVVELALQEPWDVLRLRDVPREHDELEQLSQSLRKGGCSVAFEMPMDSPYVPIPPSWEELEKRLDARFRQNLRRRHRRLEEHGPVRFELVTGAEGLDAALEDAFTIEAAGWKGEEGSAIRSRPELVSFYSAWARMLAQQGKLRLSFLCLGDTRIAFQFAFADRGRWWLPKCGFDEKYRECSPGQLLMAEALKQCITERLEVFEFLGFSMPWKRDWTPLVHPHATLWAFRSTPRGRLAGLLRGEVRPRIAQAWHALQSRFHRAHGDAT